MTAIHPGSLSEATNTTTRPSNIDVHCTHIANAQSTEALADAVSNMLQSLSSPSELLPILRAQISGTFLGKIQIAGLGSGHEAYVTKISNQHNVSLAFRHTPYNTTTEPYQPEFGQKGHVFTMISPCIFKNGPGWMLMECLDGYTELKIKNLTPSIAQTTLIALKVLHISKIYHGDIGKLLRYDMVALYSLCSMVALSKQKILFNQDNNTILNGVLISPDGDLPGNEYLGEIKK